MKQNKMLDVAMKLFILILVVSVIMFCVYKYNNIWW